MNGELDAKEVAFNRLLQWLREYGFKIENEIRNKDSSAQRQFEAKVYPPNEERRFFFVVFSNKFKDSFVVQSTIILPEEYRETIERGLRKKEQQQVYIDIYRAVFSQNIDCDTRFPRVDVHKLIFIDSLNNKQFLFDTIFNLMHSMLLVEARFDELINSFFPKGE
jgi:hypothetical protein